MKFADKLDYRQEKKLISPNFVSTPRCPTIQHSPQHRDRNRNMTTDVYHVSKNVPPLACYNFDAHEWILIFFGRNVTDKVCQKMLYYVTSNNLCLYLSKRGNTKITFFTQLDCVTHSAPVHRLPERKKIVICDVFDIV